VALGWWLKTQAAPRPTPLRVMAIIQAIHRAFLGNLRPCHGAWPPADSSRIVYLVLLIAYASSIWNGTANGWFMGPMIQEAKAARRRALACMIFKFNKLCARSELGSSQLSDMASDFGRVTYDTLRDLRLTSEDDLLVTRRAGGSLSATHRDSAPGLGGGRPGTATHWQ
jgi:hypothetical protein